MEADTGENPNLPLEYRKFMMLKRREKMDTLIKILNEIDDGINWEKEKAVIDDRLLDSFGVITLVSELEDAFGITIEASEMTEENFNSAEAMYQMILRLKEK